MQTGQVTQDNQRDIPDHMISCSVHKWGERRKKVCVCGSERCVLSKRMQDRVYNMDPGACGLPLFINNLLCSCTKRCGAFQLNKLHGSINLGPTMCSVLFLQTPWPNNHWDSCQWSEEEEKGLSWRRNGNV